VITPGTAGKAVNVLVLATLAPQTLLAVTEREPVVKLLRAVSVICVPSELVVVMLLPPGAFHV